MGGMNLAAFTAPFQYARPVQQETPWDAAAKFGQLRALAQMAQLRQAEVQNQQLQAQRMQQDLQNEAAVRQLFQGPQEPTSQQIFAAGGPKYGAEVNKGILDMHKSRADMQKAQLDHAQKEAEFIGQTLGDAKDDATYQPALAQLRAAGVDTSRMPANYDKPIVDGYITKGQTIIQQIEQRRLQNEEDRKAQLFGPTMQKVTAEAQETTAKAMREQMVLDAMRAGQQAQANGQHPIDSIFPASLDPQINASYKAAYNAARSGVPDQNGRYPMADSILSTAANHAAQIAMANNPQMIQAAANKAGAEARVTAPIHAAAAVTAAKAQYAGTPFENVSPKMLPAVLGEAKKATDDYLGAVGTANEIQDFIDSARSGNKVANAYAPTTGVMAINTANGTKRVNKAEIESYGGAGSLWDSIQGRLQKLATGQSIPKDVLDDMEKLHSTLAGNAQKTYDNHRASMKQLYNADIPPAQLPNPPRPAASAQRKVGDTVNYQGKPHKITAIDPDGKLHLAP